MFADVLLVKADDMHSYRAERKTFPFLTEYFLGTETVNTGLQKYSRCCGKWQYFTGYEISLPWRKICDVARVVSTEESSGETEGRAGRQGLQPAKLTLEYARALLKDSGEENLTSQDMPHFPLPPPTRVLRGRPCWIAHEGWWFWFCNRHCSVFVFCWTDPWPLLGY